MAMRSPSRIVTSQLLLRTCPLRRSHATDVNASPRWRQEEEHVINMVEGDPVPRNNEEANDVNFHFSDLASF